MEKFYFAKQKKLIYIATITLTIILLAAIIVNFLSIANVGNLRSTNPVVDTVVSIIMIIVLFIINLCTFLTGYKIKDNIVVCYAAYFLKYFEINTEDILLVRTNHKKTILLLYVKCDEDNADVIDTSSSLKANIIQINIHDNKIEEFITQIKNTSINIAVEILPDEETK